MLINEIIATGDNKANYILINNLKSFNKSENFLNVYDLVINSNKNNQYFRYALDKTPLNFILDKEFLIEKMNESYEKNNDIRIYSLNLKYENNLITIYFNKNDFNLMGWETTDVYQNKVETLISNIEKNIDIDLNIFRIQNYIN